MTSKPMDVAAAAAELRKQAELLRRPLRFTDKHDEFRAAKNDDSSRELVVYTGALYLDERVRPWCEKLEGINHSASLLSPLNPVHTPIQLRKLRAAFSSIEPTCRAELHAALERLGMPVEGAPGLDAAWIQGWNLAAGNAAVMRLNFALSAASEALDRKDSYFVAMMSFYFAVFSLIISLWAGWPD